jgi:hypothetical protein
MKGLLDASRGSTGPDVPSKKKSNKVDKGEPVSPTKLANRLSQELTVEYELLIMRAIVVSFCVILFALAYFGEMYKIFSDYFRTMLFAFFISVALQKFKDDQTDHSMVTFGFETQRTLKNSLSRHGFYGAVQGMIFPPPEENSKRADQGWYQNFILSPYKMTFVLVIYLLASKLDPTTGAMILIGLAVTDLILHVGLWVIRKLMKAVGLLKNPKRARQWFESLVVVSIILAILSAVFIGGLIFSGLIFVDLAAATSSGTSALKNLMKTESGVTMLNTVQSKADEYIKENFSSNQELQQVLTILSGPLTGEKLTGTGD